MARYVVRHSYVDVVGHIWMPNAVCSLRIDASSYDVANMRDDDGKITRESVEQWLMSHSGDFQSIIDFRASVEDGDETIEIPFTTEEGENAYVDSVSVDDE